MGEQSLGIGSVKFLETISDIWTARFVFINNIWNIRKIIFIIFKSKYQKLRKIFLLKGEPIQVKECGSKQKVCPPPPQLYSHGHEPSEEAERNEKAKQTKDQSKNAIYTQEGMFS